MTLIPTGGLVGLVAKLEDESPSAARNLVQLALFESLADQVDEVRTQLAPAVYEAVEDVTKRARVTLLKRSASEGADEGRLAAAEALSTVEKALFGPEKAKFERERRRDARGRFMRTNFKGMDENAARGNPAASQQTKTNEARREIKRLQNSGLITENTPIALYTMRRDDQGRPGTEMGDPLLTTPKEFEGLLETMEPGIEFTGMSIRRGDLEHINPKQQAALDLIGLFSQQDAVGSKHIFNRLKRSEIGDGNPAGNWNAPSAGGPSQDRQAYRRLKMTGQALQAVGVPGGWTSTAGGMAELIADMGPEAEKVLGPGIRRIAYRYRGTERRPDQLLREEVRVALGTVSGGGNWGDRPAANPAAAVGRHHHGKGSADQRRLRAAGDASVVYFLGLDDDNPKIPSRDLAELSMESGEVPPSQGVIIDADGDVVSQAVGYNGDHYLPFDLRNLGALKGGQYVRTRAVGGPTTEDIYTGLMTGTRQLQVVSNSGVFTLEFDPTLRGSRRYGDKARRMVERYQQMLEAIAKPDHQLYESDLSPAQVNEVRRQAAEVADSREEYDRLVRTGLERARVKASFANEDENAELLEAATHRAEARMSQEINPRDYSTQRLTQMREDYIQEEMERLGSGRVRRLQLDGAGYDRAMKALRQEFPYFIRDASWQSLPDWVRTRGMANTTNLTRDRSPDRGHVRPGQTNPEIGLRGANARRRVGDVRTTAADLPAPEQTPATQQQSQQPAASTGAAQPAAKPAVVPVMQRIMADGSPFMREFSRDSGVLVTLAAKYEPELGAIQQSEVRAGELENPRYAGYPYLQHIASSIKAKTTPGREGEAFVQHFMKATPEQRNSLIKGMRDMEAEILAGGYDNADNAAEQARQVADRIVDLVSLLDPYEPLLEGRDAMAQLVQPNETNPRPLKVEGIPDVGSDPKEFDHQLGLYQINEPGVYAAVEDLKGRTNDDRADLVSQAAAQVTERRQSGSGDIDALERKANDLHKAWSFLHTREVSEKLRKIMGGGADPKVEKAAPRRRVIVHKLHDPFSRRMRAELGIPEPESDLATSTWSRPAAT